MTVTETMAESEQPLPVAALEVVASQRSVVEVSCSVAVEAVDPASFVVDPAAMDHQDVAYRAVASSRTSVVDSWAELGRSSWQDVR